MNYIIVEKKQSIIKKITDIIKMIMAREYYDISSFDKIDKRLINTIETIDSHIIIIINVNNINKTEHKLIKKIITNNTNVIFYGKTNNNILGMINGLCNINLIIENKDFYCNLYKVLIDLYTFNKKDNFFSFSYYDEIYHLPFDSIYYIEKNIHDNSITIYTKKNEYTCYQTIKSTYEILKDDSRFIKTSRSSIINLHKIYYYNKCFNEVCLINGRKSYLVSRSMKKVLSSRLLNCNNYIKNNN